MMSVSVETAPAGNVDVSGRSESVAVRGFRWACGLGALLAGLWFSFQLAVNATELVVPELGIPWDRLQHARRPLTSSLLFGLLGVGGFRSIMRWRPLSLWLACAVPVPAWGAGVVLGWF
ncbi:hypothetical protein [Amycolatopsis anabasis]|uniref:hypothetical protein n=1 Tax=Amycolatopsis anabasis TaxID=1840409 RepID=UPI00131B5DBE|nr:hypothetical protein [Amycolatopsis anabasis]